ncbi:KdsC family phosphatase [Candidatus Omnitrophota bacterium]
MKNISTQVKKIAKKIKLLIMDVDGVLTPGYIAVTDKGQELKIFDVHDGFGLMLWRREGFKSAIITAGDAAAVQKRADCLKIDCVYLKAMNKLIAYEDIKNKLNIGDEQICFIGDDLIDIPILRRVGFPCCVSNARKELLPFVKYVTKNSGGRGAIREIIEILLKGKGLWKNILDLYTKR